MVADSDALCACVQLFWYPPLQQVWMYSYNSSDMAEQFVPGAGPGALPGARPLAAQNHLVTAQAVGGRRRLAEGLSHSPSLTSTRAFASLPLQGC